MLDAIILANTIIDKFHSNGKIIRLMKLQKLLYFLTGFAYKENATSLIIDEYFYKLDYGPVCIEIYHKFKQFSYHPIQKIPSKDDEIYTYEIEGKEKSLFDKIYKRYGHFKDFTLSEMTHRENSPWDTAEFYYPIDKKSIKEYFSNIKIGEY